MEFNRNGCFIVLLAFTTNLVWGCVVKSLGVLLPVLRDQFTTQTWIIGIVTSLVAVTSDIVGLFTLPLEKLFGCRLVLISSGVIGCLGLFLLPFASNPIHVALSLAVLAGPALGIYSVLAKVLIGRHFREQYATACGIGHAGQALAFLVFAPMTQLFLDTYGWRGATLLIAGFSMHQIPTAVLVKAVNPQYKSLADADNRNDPLHNFDTEIKEAEKRRKSSAPVSFKELCSLIYRALDLGIFLEFNFWIVLMCRFGVTTSFISWLLYFVPHLQAKGFNPQVAASLCIAAAVGFSFGTLIWSPFIDRGLIKSSTAIIITSLVLTLSFVVDPWVHDVIGYAITAFLCGLFSSALYTLTDVITKEIVDSDRLVAAFGWMRAFFFGRLIAGFVPGWIYDMRGSYDLAFIVIGLIPTFSLLPLVIALIRKTI